MKLSMLCERRNSWRQTSKLAQAVDAILVFICIFHNVSRNRFHWDRRNLLTIFSLSNLWEASWTRRRRFKFVTIFKIFSLMSVILCKLWTGHIAFLNLIFLPIKLNLRWQPSTIYWALSTWTIDWRFEFLATFHHLDLFLVYCLWNKHEFIMDILQDRGLFRLEKIVTKRYFLLWVQDACVRAKKVQVDNKLRAFTNFAINFYRTTHLLDYIFANWQS